MSPTKEDLEFERLKNQIRKLKADAQQAVEERDAARQELRQLKELHMNVWKEIDALKSKYNSEFSNASETAKECGFKGVKCSEVGLVWTAVASDAAKYSHLPRRPKVLGPFKTSAELIAAMRDCVVVPTIAGGATGITPEDDAKARAFIDQVAR